MTDASRLRRPVLLLAAAAVALGGLTGCAQIEGLTGRADQARQRIRNLERVEFRVGERTFTF